MPVHCTALYTAEVHSWSLSKWLTSVWTIRTISLRGFVVDVCAFNELTGARGISAQ